MKIPDGMTEKQVLDAIEKAVHILAPSFVFGHFTVEDIKQQGYLIAFKLLEKNTYDPKRPLENYLYTDIRRKLINFRRDNSRRNDPPCKECHDGTPCAKAVGNECKKYSAWLKRNNDKVNIHTPMSIDYISEEKESKISSVSLAEEEVEINDVLRRIDEKLPIEYRATYLQMRAGVSVPKTTRIKIENIVKEILKGDIESCPSEED